MKIYVAGPITGRAGRNREEFERVQWMLLRVGHDARIPHTFGSLDYDPPDRCEGLKWYPRAITDVPQPTPEDLWRDWMWYDLHALAAWRPEAIVLLEDWKESRGAVCEAALFSALALRTIVNRGIGFFENVLAGGVDLPVPRQWFFEEATGRLQRGADTPADDPFQHALGSPQPLPPRHRAVPVASEMDWLERRDG